jgi:hypothetical protein
MPVSKKRKKDGKPVHRKVVVETAPDAAAPHGPEAPAAPVGPRPMTGKPANPFLSMQQSRRGSQRGR